MFFLGIAIAMAAETFYVSETAVSKITTSVSEDDLFTDIDESGQEITSEQIYLYEDFDGNISNCDRLIYSLQTIQPAGYENNIQCLREEKNMWQTFKDMCDEYKNNKEN